MAFLLLPPRGTIILRAAVGGTDFYIGWRLRQPQHIFLGRLNNIFHHIIHVAE
jgi:hypothetical protein